MDVVLFLLLSNSLFHCLEIFMSLFTIHSGSDDNFLTVFFLKKKFFDLNNFCSNECHDDDDYAITVLTMKRRRRKTKDPNLLFILPFLDVENFYIKKEKKKKI